jgi:arabinose-5-phosphate isomerase
MGFRYGTGRYYHLHFNGNSPEIKRLSPFKTFWRTLIAITGMTSFLAKNLIILNTTVDAEACPNNLAPTNSTTAQLVMETHAVCLMQLHNFKAEDFAKYHQGGAGKKIIARVKDMLKHTLKPMVFLIHR